MEYREIKEAEVAYATLKNNIAQAEAEHVQVSIGLKLQEDMVTANVGDDEAERVYTAQAETSRKRLSQIEKMLQSYYAQIDQLPKSAVQEVV